MASRHNANQLMPIPERSGAAVTANLLMGLGIDDVLTRTDGAGTRGFLTDALGSTIALVDNTGAVLTQYTYEPFGAVNRIGAASQNSYTYTGREDDGSGLYYYRARYYHPRLQRFISEDPIRFAGGQMNLYGYVHNSALNFRDPRGMKEYPNNFIGPIEGSGYYTSQMTVTTCGRIPPAPQGVSIYHNIQEAQGHWNPFWFKSQVRNGGRWDYKQISPLYEDFGNFNYGATGSAIGFSDSTLLREAGRAQQNAGTSKPEWGDPGWLLNPWGGTAPYGDDPADQFWIRRGINFCGCQAP